MALAECLPFVIFDEDKYSGLAVYLWEQVVREMGIASEYKEYPLGGLLDMIPNWEGSQAPDVGISCTSVTAETRQNQTPAERRTSMTWAQRLKRVFDIDVA